MGEPHEQHHPDEGLETRLAELVRALEAAPGTLAVDAATAAAEVEPGWRRATTGEPRWPMAVAVVVMIALQSVVPEHLTLARSWALPVLEGALLVTLLAVSPRRITRSSRVRLLSLTMIALASLANGWSAGNLVVGLVRGAEGGQAGPLLVTGGNIWLTNVLVFGLWYWELDRGGPGARARAERDKPDFLFPEMTSPDLADPDWEPRFLDYLYLAYTNATAFSPTDTLPFSRWSKLAMMIQSAISLTTGALVIARAVNILR